MAAALLLLAASVLLLWPRDRAPESVWQPASRTFTPERCAQGECEELLRLPPAGDDVVSVIVDPAVDDEIAQWSDCLASVAQCVESSTGEGGATTLRACVRESRCPAVCRERFAGQAEGIDDAEALWALYERQFVHEGGICVPQG